MTHLNPQLAAESLAGLLTAASLLWGLQNLIVWRAIETKTAPRGLGWALVALTVVAFITVAAALASLDRLALGQNDAALDIAYLVALFGTLALGAIVTVYYLLILGAFITRRRT